MQADKLTDEQQRIYDLLLAIGRANAAIAFAADILLGRELADVILRRPARLTSSFRNTN